MIKHAFIVVGSLTFALVASQGAEAASRHRAHWAGHATHTVRMSARSHGRRRIRFTARTSMGRQVVAPSAAAPSQGLLAALFAPQTVAPQTVAQTAQPKTRAQRAVVRGAGVQVGRASYYSGAGHTANGGHVGAATCAHRSLPFGTKVLVTNLANARQAVLTVNDRGPFVRGRVLDVSRGAAGMLGMLHAGVSSIKMQVVGGPG